MKPVRQLMTGLGLAAVMVACGHGEGTSPGGVPPYDINPGATASPAPTPTPSLPGSMLRLQPIALADGTGQRARSLVLSNAMPGSKASFDVALGGKSAYRLPTDPHIARLRREAAALAGIVPAPPRYRLAQSAPDVGATQDFYVQLDTDPKSTREAKVTATLAARGEHCYVWVDPASASTDADRALLAARAKAIVSTFDSGIYPTDTRLFGSEPNPGVDGDPRIHILISPAIDDYGANPTLGYYSRRDEYPAQANGPALLRHSNAKELINVTSEIVLTGTPEDYLGTIAHEFQHMINFNQKVLLGHHPDGEDLWIDEGMAMYALEANGYGLRGGGKVLLGHVRAFQAAPASFSLDDWANNPQGIGYGAVYLFMVYLADRFGEGILHEIVARPDVGFANIEGRLEGHGSRFTDVFADWATANLIDHKPGATAPRYSYTTLDMHGTYGSTALDGFQPTAISDQGVASVVMRPCTLLYAQLPAGQELPRLTVPSGVDVQPPLMLP